MILSYVCEKKNKLWFMHELYKVSVVFHWASSLRQGSGFRFWNLTSSSLSSTCHLSTRYQISSLPAFYSAVSVRFWDASLLTFSNGGGKNGLRSGGIRLNLQDLVTDISEDFPDCFVPNEMYEYEICLFLSPQRDPGKEMRHNHLVCRGAK